MRRRQRGVVLVIALAILAGLVALVASIVASQQIALRAEANRVNAGRARIAAEAGIQRAVASLADTIQDATAATTSTTVSSTAQGQAQTQTDEWYTLGNKGAEKFTVGSGSFRMEIVDAGSMVDLNVAPEAQLNLLPLTTQQIAALLDWREATPTARTEGAKDDYYNALPKPYNTSLRRFQSVGELLDVRYFTPPDIWQVNSNATSAQQLPVLADDRQPVLADLVTTDSSSALLNPSGSALINVSGQPAPALVPSLTAVGISGPTANLIAGITQGQNPPPNSPSYADLGAVFQAVRNASATDRAAILDNVTVGAATKKEGLLNLNTATEATLMSLPNMTADLAQGIVNYQATGFTKLSDLLLVSGFSDATALQNFAKFFTVRSSVFLVHVVGECNGSQIALEGVVDTSSGVPRLVKMHDQPYSDMPTRWGWSDETTNETVLVEAK